MIVHIRIDGNQVRKFTAKSISKMISSFSFTSHTSFQAFSSHDPIFLHTRIFDTREVINVPFSKPRLNSLFLNNQVLQRNILRYHCSFILHDDSNKWRAIGEFSQKGCKRNLIQKILLMAFPVTFILMVLRVLILTHCSQGSP